MGAVSLIFWALVIVVTIKYVGLHHARRQQWRGRRAGAGRTGAPLPGQPRAKTAIGVAALMGLALFYGDGMLTPAISVLSAVEGLGGSPMPSSPGSCPSPW